MPPTDWANGCNITTRGGGVSRLFFLVCDPDMVLPNENGWANPDNWIWAICNGYLHVTGHILGQQPKMTFTKKKIESCAPEQVVAGEQQITAQDYNADNDNLYDFSFWDGVRANKKFMYVGWLSCDDLVYQTTAAWDIEAGPVIEEDGVNGNTYHDIAITVSTINPVTPFKCTGLAAALDAYTYAGECY